MAGNETSLNTALICVATLGARGLAQELQGYGGTPGSVRDHATLASSSWMSSTRGGVHGKPPRRPETEPCHPAVANWLCGWLPPAARSEGIKLRGLLSQL